jgi:hypothetical protein
MVVVVVVDDIDGVKVPLPVTCAWFFWLMDSSIPLMIVGGVDGSCFALMVSVLDGC